MLRQTFSWEGSRSPTQGMQHTCRQHTGTHTRCSEEPSHSNPTGSRGGAPPLPLPPRWQPPPPCRPLNDRRASAFRLSVIGLLGIAAAPSSPRPAADFQNTGQQRSAARRPLALRCSSRQPWMSRASEWDRARRSWTAEPAGSLRRLPAGSCRASLGHQQLRWTIGDNARIAATQAVARLHRRQPPPCSRQPAAPLSLTCAGSAWS